MQSAKYRGSQMGPASVSARPALRAAAIARWGAFSGVIRPNHTAESPPGPSGQRAASTPLGTTSNGPPMVFHASAVWADTAANRVRRPPVLLIADSSHGVGGVCTVVNIGVDNIGAIATGR